MNKSIHTNIRILFVCVVLSVFPRVVSGQQYRFHSEVTSSGNCTGLDHLQGAVFLEASRSMANTYNSMIFSSKAECEATRNSFAGTQNVTGCIVTITCTMCTPIGSSSSSSINTINPSGPTQGSSYFSSNPANEILDWSEDTKRLQEALGYVEYKEQQSLVDIELSTGVSWNNIDEYIKENEDHIDGNALSTLSNIRLLKERILELSNISLRKYHAVSSQMTGEIFYSKTMAYIEYRDAVSECAAAEAIAIYRLFLDQVNLYNNDPNKEISDQLALFNTGKTEYDNIYNTFLANIEELINKYDLDVSKQDLDKLTNRINNQELVSNVASINSGFLGILEILDLPSGLNGVIEVPIAYLNIMDRKEIMDNYNDKLKKMQEAKEYYEKEYEKSEAINTIINGDNVNLSEMTQQEKALWTIKMNEAIKKVQNYFNTDYRYQFELFPDKIKPIIDGKETKIEIR
ncbi:MAG: hypothetical protein J6X88_07600 [Bacteroidales bacterium]|nr:hypothetical protein [Bacteroidales bacterium]